MSGETIKSFLIGLGWDIDDAGLNKFNQAITMATLKANLLSKAIIETAKQVGGALSSVSDDFEELGYTYRLITPMINKAIVLKRELFKAYNSAGIDIQKTVLASVRLNMSLTKTRFALEAIYKSTASKFFSLITHESDMFRKKIYENMPKIIAFLEKYVRMAIYAVESLVRLGSYLIDLFEKVDKATNGWSTKLVAFLAFWKLFGASLLTANIPLTLILTGLAALLLLFDDFKAFQEHRKSYFDWSMLLEWINKISKAFKDLGSNFDFKELLNDMKEGFKAVEDQVKDLLEQLKLIPVAIRQFKNQDWKGLSDTLTKGGILEVDKMKKGYNFFEWGAAFGLGLRSGIKNYVGGEASSAADSTAEWLHKFLIETIAPFLYNSAPSVSPSPTPLGSTDNSQRHSFNNVNVQQQTTILTQPGADANTIGRIAGNSMSTKTIFDAITNLQGNIVPGGSLT